MSGNFMRLDEFSEKIGFLALTNENLSDLEI